MLIKCINYIICIYAFHVNMCFVFVFNLILCVTVFEGFESYNEFVESTTALGMLVIDLLLLITIRELEIRQKQIIYII